MVAPLVSGKARKEPLDLVWIFRGLWNCRIFHITLRIFDVPDRSSILVFVSMADLCCPGTGALRGMIVGTATAPAVILSVSTSVREIPIVLCHKFYI